MALKDQIPFLLEQVAAHKDYLQYNNDLLKIFNGKLLPYVDLILKKTLSDNYYQKIKSRILPINVLKRVTDKSSRAYSNKPVRETEEKYKLDLDFYKTHFYLDQAMNKADEYSFLFKGYALEPFLHNGLPKLRVLPFDRFIPISIDRDDPTYVTHFVKIMGKIKIARGNGYIEKDLYYAYTKDEFIAFTGDQELYLPDMASNEGVNPYGVIPFLYGNRGNDEIIPTQDTDVFSLTTILPVLMTDLAGAIMFQCFTIMYGIDVSAENLTMSPNAFWSLKSDKSSDKNPQLGTLKPEADIEKVISYIMTTFTFWLETKGIRVGNMGSTDVGAVASGISKIIDEMDTTEITKKSMECFKKEEHQFFQMLKPMNNYWVQNNMLAKGYKPNLWLDDFQTTTIFDEPEPYLDRKTQVETIKMERDAGFLDQRSAIIELYPDLSPEQVDERMALTQRANTIEVEEDQAIDG